MNRKKTALVINPRVGTNIAKLPDILSLLAAAGWETTITFKEYGGHTMQLAYDAAENRHDLVIAYGGDGTINQVINGIMHSKTQHSIVGVIPGGTANVWAGEIGIPTDPIKATLSLIHSEQRKIDLGHVNVQNLTFADEQPTQIQGKQKCKKAVRESRKARHHFLLMAGLGLDAAIMGNVSKTMKQHIGPLAVGLTALEQLPEQHAFPIKILAMDRDQQGELLWEGEALQVVIGNTRHYGGITEITPNAYIDDSVLDVCVITAGNLLTTMQQITSLLLRRHPDSTSAKYFHGTHLSIIVPSYVALQLDGSMTKLKDYLSKADYAKLQQTDKPEQTMVTYQFDAMPRALDMAIPSSYNKELFEQKNGNGQSHTNEVDGENLQGHTRDEELHPLLQLQQAKSEAQQATEVNKDLPSPIDANACREHGRTVTVIGKVPDTGRKHTYIIAGQAQKMTTNDIRPVAVVANEKTTIFDTEGRPVSLDTIQNLQEGAVITVEGKKSKRSIIHATHMILG